jgi:hypothetical protein
MHRSAQWAVMRVFGQTPNNLSLQPLSESGRFPKILRLHTAGGSRCPSKWNFIKTAGNCMFTSNTKGTPMNFKIVGSALVILIFPVIQSALYNIGPDPNTKLLYFYFLRNNQFANLVELINTSKPKDIPKIALNQYYDCNKIAEFYCYLGTREYDSLAYVLWKRLILTASENGECDSALFLAEFWVKYMPGIELPEKILVLAKRAKEEEKGKKMCVNKSKFGFLNIVWH